MEIVLITLLANEILVLIVLDCNTNLDIVFILFKWTLIVYKVILVHEYITNHYQVCLFFIFDAMVEYWNVAGIWAIAELIS